MAGLICNIQAEAALLGSIIEDSRVLNLCRDEKITQYDFAGDGYGFIFEILKRMIKEKIEVDATTLYSEIKRVGADVDISTLTQIQLQGIPSNSEYYIREVKMLSRKRNLSEKLKDLRSEIEGLSLEELKSEIENISRDFSDGENVKLLFRDASEIKRVKIDGGLETGFESIDKLTNGLVFGSLTILTGEPSSGKSTFLNQVIAQNLMNKQRTMLYSGELTDFQVLQWFMRCVANLNDLAEYKGKFGPYYDVSPKGEDLIRKWIENRLFIFAEESKANIENLLLGMDYMARSKNVKLFILDNLMTVENDNLEELEKQKTLAKKLKNFAKKYECCVILVAHPKKKNFTDKNSKVYHMHDVSGASEIVNLADYEFILTRDIKNTENGRVDETKIGILKNRQTGIQGMSQVLNFDKIRKRFYTCEKEKNKNYKYDELNQYSFVELNEASEDVPF